MVVVVTPLSQLILKRVLVPVRYSESIKLLSVLHSGLKREWQPIFTPQKIQKNIFIKAFLCSFLV